MSDVRVAVVGAAGRMGGALIRSVNEADGISLTGALERKGAEKVGTDSGILAGVGENGVLITDDLDAVVENCDGIIDFTVPSATVALAEVAAKQGRFHIIGTTGCVPEDDSRIEMASKKTAIVKSGNMSLGVNLLAILVEQAASALPADAFDIEVLEMHHKHKIDAPSGTALLLGESAAKGRGIELGENSVRSRDGITGARDQGKIGFATLRGGAVIGEHSVILAGDSERIVLSHQAQDRSLFATGAVRAALWASGKPAGLYSMRDVLGL